ncbi:hypothetical protein [Leptolyngbya sp. 7M]|uniref:hypothetical protein n=1 Tax=Leptolyngbya sp. 7M TaxID=2812896 RepID=UPI0021F10B41|nr:hypothetical protein [Leptolyngbya sp. 7M]
MALRAGQVSHKGWTCSALESIPGKPTARAFECFLRCYERGLLIRTTGDIIALSPPLIIEKQHIDQLFGMLAEVLKELP